MKILATLLASCLLLFACAFALPAMAQGEKRIALVVGNAAYQAGPLATAANDAGLIAQTLQAAGFDVSGARDLDGDSLRSAFRDFLDKAQASGPDTVAFIYLSGYGLQLDGENYFAPVDAKIASASDVAADAVRITDYTRRLAGLPLKASFVVLDLARASPFGSSGQPLAGGLALAEADPNMLVAFNAAPGTVAPAEEGPYGAYPRALAEMIREGGLSPSQVFDAVRLRVNEETKGAEVPWSESRISAAFVFFERAADAPPPPYNVSEAGAMQGRSMRELGVQDAYAAAIERDSMEGYEDFLAAYPSDPLAGRVRALLAARREARVWRRTCVINTPDAYWSYLGRYPRGPHADEARWRLEALSAPAEPPASFAPVVYDVPPPPPAEIVYVERPVLVLSDPAFGFVPPPPIVFLAPVPAYLVFPPPPPPLALFVLPIPVFVPFPAFISPPPFVVPPPNNVFFENIHNTTVINNINNTIINRGAAAVAGTTAAGVAAGAAAAALAAKLPPSVARKSETMGLGLRGAGTAPVAPWPGAQPGQKPLPGLPGKAQTAPSHALPGMDGKPLPGQQGKPGAPGGQKPPPGLPGAAQNRPGKALPGAPGGKPLPEGAALPGAPGGKPLPGQAGKPGTPGGQKPPRLPGAAQNPPGHALPGAPGEKPPPGGGASPGPGPGGRGAKGGPTGAAAPAGGAPPPGRQERLPKGPAHPPPGLSPPGGGPPSAGPRPGPGPRPERPARPAQQRPPQPPHPKRETPQAFSPPRPPPQAQQWRPPPPQAQQWRPPPQAQQWRPPPQAQQWRPPPQGQQWRPPPPQAQQWRPPPQQAQQWRPPPPQAQQWRPPQQQSQQKRECGKPGLPPCR